MPQSVTNFSVSQAPMTAALLVEFASTNYWFMGDALEASYAFANTLRKTTGSRLRITTCSRTSWSTSPRIRKRSSAR